MKFFYLIWETALNYLEEDLNTFQFNTWIRSLEPVRHEDDDFYFIVKSAQEKELTDLKYIDKLKDAMQMAFKDVVGIPNSNLNPHVILKSEESKQQKEQDKIKYKSITLDPAYTFDSFVVGECNNFANKMARNVAQNPGKTYNPLFLYGGPSLGKTHLIQAIGNYIQEHTPEAQIVYVSSETFKYELISMIQGSSNNMNVDFREQFRNRYRTIDVLLMDDIQFLEGTETSQDEFFHTFNALHQRGKQIVISSDKPPHELKKLEKRLISRLEWGVNVDINPPDYETRTAILMKKAKEIEQSRGFSLEINNEVFDFIASKVTTDIRKLEGYLKKVLMYAEFNKDYLKINEIDINVAKKALISSN